MLLFVLSFQLASKLTECNLVLATEATGFVPRFQKEAVIFMFEGKKQEIK